MPIKLYTRQNMYFLSCLCVIKYYSLEPPNNLKIKKKTFPGSWTSQEKEGGEDLALGLCFRAWSEMPVPDVSRRARKQVKQESSFFGDSMVLMTGHETVGVARPGF